MMTWLTLSTIRRVGDVMKSWYILGYTQGGAAYCRECVAETLGDEGFRDPYITDEHDDWKPIFLSDIEDNEYYCEYCFEELE